MTDQLRVNEIYLSLQGESTFAGLPCIFVRLTGCNLRCSYCDTAYAFTEGEWVASASALEKVRQLSTSYRNRNANVCGTPVRMPIVEFTGGEPLLQKEVLPVMASLCDEGFTVLVETSGAIDIRDVDPRVRRIMDLKCPSSGEVERNRLQNLALLKSTDEIKFVIGTLEDYEWAKERIREYQLENLCPLLFSWVHPLAPEQRHASLKTPPKGTPISRQALAEKIIAEALPVRFQAQLHKIIWAPEQRGV